MGQLVQLRDHQAEALVTKAQLALHLGVSVRWLEHRVNEGLPNLELHRWGKGCVRRFRVSDVEAWLERRMRA